MSAEVTKLPDAALEAWAEYDPPEYRFEFSRIRDAFMSGFLAALAIEARRATTTEIGVVHESAGPKDNAQNMSGPSHE